MSSNTSTGQIVGYVVGAVAAYFTFGASYVALGAAIGGAVGGAIDPPKGPKIAGPRLSDLGQQTATYGAVIPRIYGAAAVAGNIFWIENNALKEVASTEEQGGKGGGGGGAEVTTYKYYATFALGLCEGPIEGIRRIWVSGRLIYDAGTSDFDTAYATSQLAAGITIYKGTEIQTANPRMQATLGAANTPAYRGLAYLVFEDFDLTDYGNTLIGAQFKVEVIKNASYSSNQLKQWAGAIDIPGVTYVCPISIKGRSSSTRYIAGPNFAMTSARVYTLLDDGSFSYQPIGVDSKYGAFSFLSIDISVDNFNIAVAGASWDKKIILYGPTFGVHGELLTTRYNDNFLSFCEVNGAGIGLAWGYPSILANPETYAQVHKTNGIVMNVPVSVDASSIIRHAGSLTDFYILSANRVVKCAGDSVWSEYLITRPSGADNRIDDAYINDGYLFRIYRKTSSNLYDNVYYDVIDLSSMSVIYAGYAVMPTINNATLTWKTYIDGMIISQAGQCNTSTVFGVLGIFEAHASIKSISPVSVSLGQIINSECTLSGLSSGDLDVTAMTDAVKGFRVSQVAALRSNIEPLQGAWPFDIIQSGYKVKFKKRGASSSVASIAETQLAARAGSGKGEARLTQSREMDTQLPVRVSINFLDIGREYDANEQYCERLGTGSVNVRQVEMPIVMSATEAVQKAEVLLYMYWLDRYEFAFRLPPSFNAIEPGDVVTLTAGGASYQLRLTSVHWQSDGVIDCTARLNDNATYTSTAVADPGLQYQSTIKLRGATAWEMLDIPTIADAQDAPGFLAAIGRYKSGWPGGVVYKSTDGQSWSLVDSTNMPVAIGFTRAAIAAPVNFGMVDKASRLQVIVHAAALYSVTEGQMLNGANHFAYGKDGRWEIIAAQNCTLQGDGSYILTDFLRGRFGTEWAASQHADGDRIVRLSSSLLKFVAASANVIGVPMQTKGITIGDDLSSAAAADFTYRGVNLECLAPVYLNGNRSAGGDWSLEWIRRGRTGGEWRDNVDVPLGEASERYEIEIYTNGSYATLKRTLSSTAPAVSYTSAQQVADFGSNQATLYVKVYQLSAIVGRGTPLTTSITR